MLWHAGCYAWPAARQARCKARFQGTGYRVAEKRDGRYGSSLSLRRLEKRAARLASADPCPVTLT